MNPSWLIARAVHDRLDLADGHVLRLHVVPEAVRVSYQDVRSQIPPLLFPPVTHDPPPTFDLVVFIGMAAGREYYSVESRAFRDGYNKPDTDGKILDGVDQDLWKERYGSPEMLTPPWDSDDVWRRWKNQNMDLDVRVSDDAGRYLCEFIYFTGLVEYWRRGRAHEGQVAFMHVPKDHDSQSVEIGVKAAETLIKAMAQSAIARGHLKTSRSTR